jgi:hypothetical protein
MEPPQNLQAAGEQAVRVACTVAEARLQNAGRQMREWERGLVQMVIESGNVAEAVEATGYSYADVKAMAERGGVRL